MVKRSSGPISRGPGGDRVAVKVAVVQMGRVNDQMGVFKEMRFQFRPGVADIHVGAG